MLSALGSVLVAAVLTSADETASEAIALHPLVVIGADAAQTASVDAEYSLAAVRLKVPLASSEEVSRFLASRSEGCGADDGCLAALARASGARAALMLVVSPAPKKLTVSGRLVRRDGATLSSVKRMELERPEGPSWGAALAPVIEKLLDDETTEPLPLVEKGTATAPSGPPQPAPAAAVAGSGLPLKTAGLVAAGLGVASLAGGGLVVLMAGADQQRVRDRLDPEGRAWDDESVQLNASLRQRSIIANAALIAGGALTVTGAALFLLGPSQAPAVTAVAAPGVAQVVVFQRF